MRNNPSSGRKGAAHVVEAILAAAILVFFVLSITMLGDSSPEQQTTLIQQQTRNVLQSIDMNGTLRPAATRRDLSTIRSTVAQYIPDRRVEIALQALNATSRDVSFTDQHTVSFTITEAVERQRLRVWYRNATAANVSINGQYIANHTDRLRGRYETYRIGGVTVTGANTLRIDTVGAADVGYSIDRYTQYQTGKPPADQTVFTTSYIVSGTNTTFAPTEVTVISWY